MSSSSAKGLLTIHENGTPYIDILAWQRMEERVRFELRRLRCEITFYRARLEEDDIAKHKAQ